MADVILRLRNPASCSRRRLAMLSRPVAPLELLAADSKTAYLELMKPAPEVPGNSEWEWFKSASAKYSPSRKTILLKEEPKWKWARFAKEMLEEGRLNLA